MKNILFFTPFVNSGDLLRYTESLMRSLAVVAEARGWRIDVLGQRYAEGGVLIHYPDSFHFEQIDPQKPLPQHPNLINYLRVHARVFVGHLKRIAPDYDLIFCPNAYWSTAETWEVETPLIALVPDLGWDMVEMGDFFDMFMSEAACRIAESAAHTVFWSDFFRQMAIERYAFDESKTSVVPNCAETYAPRYMAGSRAVERVRINYNLPDRYLLLPNAAGYRGLDIGLIGFGLARTADATLPPLVLAGYEMDTVRNALTPYGARIQELIVVSLGLKVNHDIIVLDLLAPEDEGALYAGAEMVIVPSRMDGDVSGAVYQAIQTSTSVIYSDIPPFVERLGADGHYGRVFPVDDAEALGKQILNSWSESPYERENYVNAAHGWAQQYGAAQWVEQYADLFDRVMAQDGEAAMTYREQQACRSCGGALKTAFELGEIYSSNFLVSEAELPEKAPLTLTRCQQCGLVQLAGTLDLDSMYRTYYYRSGINASMVESLRNVIDEAMRLVDLKTGDVVVDIGANDMTMLSMYPEYVYTVAYEPARNLPRLFEPSIFINEYFSASHFPFEAKAKIVTSIAMFYDLPDPNQFVCDVKQILDPSGIWIIQLNDLKSMLELNAFDAIGHEHLEYYSIIDIMNLMTREGLEIFRIEHNGVNGGSLRFYIDWRGERPIEDSVLKHMREEYDYLESPEGTIEAFAERVEQHKATVVRWLQLEAAQGRKVYGLAASTKGNTLLQSWRIDSHLLTAIADKNPDKFGKVTVGTRIPIVPEEEALKAMPDAMLILAWGFTPFFLTSMLPYLRGGGALVVPLPEPRVYSYEHGTGQVVSYSLAQVVNVWEAESGD